ncbi:MAG: hypothetical protein U9R15_17500, partial [Chloroflexota bacterium]|nr:hypothetical protein [Chloroflexota bacterium]
MTKADETFQESVQALANWLTFLEGKLNYYTRQLERARAHQSQGEQPVEVETPPVAPVEETKKAEASFSGGVDWRWGLIGSVVALAVIACFLVSLFFSNVLSLTEVEVKKKEKTLNLPKQ